MKVCQGCGTVNNDTALFCQSCNMRLNLTLEELRTKRAVQKEILDAFSRIFTSWLMLVIIIVNFALLMFNTYRTITTFSNVNAASILCLDSVEGMPPVNVFILLIAVLAAVCSMLLTVGALRQNSAARSALDSMDASGMRSIKTGIKVSIAMTIIYAALLLLATVYAYMSVTENNVSLLIIRVIALILFIPFCFRLMKVTDSINFAIITKTPFVKISNFIIILCYVFAGLLAVSFVYYLSLSDTLCCICLVLYGIMLKQIKTAMLKIKSDPAYEGLYGRADTKANAVNTPNTLNSDDPLSSLPERVSINTQPIFSGGLIDTIDTAEESEKSEKSETNAENQR